MQADVDMLLDFVRELHSRTQHDAVWTPVWDVPLSCDYLDEEAVQEYLGRDTGEPVLEEDEDELAEEDEMEEEEEQGILPIP
jgi:hypothetical protein